MLAIKLNKSYKCDEQSKGSYLADGYDIYNDDGKTLVQASPKKSIPYNDYMALKKELEALKKAQK